MRETISYNKTKNGMEEFLKLKPDTNVKGKVTVQLINNETKEVEQEIFTENIRMKWLDYQMHLNAVQTIGCVWELIGKYAGETTSSGKPFNRGNDFKYLLLYSSEDEENEKNASLDGNLIGYCGFETTYSGTDVRQGSFNLVESNIKNDSEGNLVMHNVYDFPTHACNGTITHVGYGKVLDDTLYYYNYVNFATNWQNLKGLPSTLTASIGAISCQASSWNCYHVGKNVFRFVLQRKKSTYVTSYYLIELDIVTGNTLKNIELLGYDNLAIDANSTYIRMIQMSKDGSSIYILTKSNVINTNVGATTKGLTFLTLSADTGKILDCIHLGNTIGAGDTGYVFSDYSIAVYDEGKSLYMFGGVSSGSTNYLSEIDLTTKKVVKWTSPYSYNDTDSISSSDIYRGALVLNGDDEIVYKRTSQQSTKNHLVFDKTSLALKRKYNDNKDKPTLSLDIIGHEGLSISICTSVDDSNGNTSSNYAYWGIYDRRKKMPMSTLTKLPSSVLKTAAFTMKVQYDVIFEMPNVLEGFTEVPL